jgi:hypothetical protein
LGSDVTADVPLPISLPFTKNCVSASSLRKLIVSLVPLNIAAQPDIKNDTITTNEIVFIIVLLYDIQNIKWLGW